MITRTSRDERRRQRNAREASAQASRDRQQPKPEIDWDAAIARAKQMVDDIERKHRKR